MHIISRMKKDIEFIWLFCHDQFVKINDIINTKILRIILIAKSNNQIKMFKKQNIINKNWTNW